jgi:hypothetical protein
VAGTRGQLVADVPSGFSLVSRKKKKNLKRNAPLRCEGILLDKEYETSISHFLNFDISLKGALSLVLQSPLPRAAFELEIGWVPDPAEHVSEGECDSKYQLWSPMTNVLYFATAVLTLLCCDYRMCPRPTAKNQFESEISHNVPGLMKLGASRLRNEYTLLQFLLYICSVVSSSPHFLS